MKEFTEAKASFQRIDQKTGANLSEDSTMSQSVFVKKLPREDRCHVLCVSEGREKKEIAMDSLKEERFVQGLNALQTTVAKGNVKLLEKVGERVGRLKERYPSIARHYEITLDLDADQKKVTALFWTKKPTRTERTTLTGCYVIETSHKELSAEEVWKLYTTLTQVEYAFRSLKTDLGVRPVYINWQTERALTYLLVYSPITY